MWLNKDNYSDYLKGINVVEVSGESCANCLTLMPILDRLISERTDCKLYHIEASNDTMDLIEKYENLGIDYKLKDTRVHTKEEVRHAKYLLGVIKDVA